VATRFDATARINLDLRSFAQGSQAITKAGGHMERIFQNLNNVMGSVAKVEKQTAAELRKSLSVYNSLISTVGNYASAISNLPQKKKEIERGSKRMAQALTALNTIMGTVNGTSRAQSAEMQRTMALYKNLATIVSTLSQAQGKMGQTSKGVEKAFTGLRNALSSVQGMGEKEYARLSRTITLYERMAAVVTRLAGVQRTMAQITQNAAAAEQKAELARLKALEATSKLALQEEKLRQAREKHAQAAQRLAQEDERLALSRQRLAMQTNTATGANASYSRSSYAMRSSVGELEQSFMSLLQIISHLPLAMAQAAISQEQAFAQVARVIVATEEETQGLKRAFQDIAANAPISFEEVSRIGQLGAQIGISTQQLENFTDTIVRFSLTTGVSADEATLLLGRIAQMQDVPISEMEQLGSAILALGTASVATDQEILRINSSIATVSNLFGLTKQETAGLSAALASLQVRPELSRGALTRVFNQLSTAVNGSSTEVAKLSTVMGITSEEAKKLYKTDPGGFFLTFVEGLSRAAGAGGEVQGVLRELGVNAVRDIDVFSRLANNVDIVRESFSRADEEYAKGSELMRQSKGIYETTAAEIQNLGDSFQNTLAILGGPLGQAVGTVAGALSEVVEFVGELGPIAGILGSVATAATAGAAAWLVWRIASAKAITAAIASREVMATLGTTTLRMRDAMTIYRDGLPAAAAAQGRLNTAQTASSQAMASQVAAQGRVAAATRVATSAYMQNLTVNQQAATNSARYTASILAQNRATVTAVPGARAYALATSQATNALMQQATASAVATAASRGLTNAVALTGGSFQRQAQATHLVAQQQAVLAAGATASGNALRQQGQAVTQVAQRQTALVSGTFASANSLRQQTTAAAQATIGQRSLATQSVATSAAISAAAVQSGRAAGSIGATGMAARAASIAFGPWGIALTTLALIFGPTIASMGLFTSEAEKISKAALEATGGTKALGNAIRADTEAAIKAAGGQEKYNAAVASGSAEALRGIGAYRTLTVSKENASTKDREAAENAIARARAEQIAIETANSSISSLREQAKGTGESARAAAGYVAEWEKAEGVIRKNTQALSENTMVLGEQAAAWLRSTAEAAVGSSKLANGSKISADALDQLGKSGLNVGELLKRSMTDPQGALDELDAAITKVSATADNYMPGGMKGEFAEQLSNEAAAAQRLKGFLEALRTTLIAQEGEFTKNEIAASLLGEAYSSTGKEIGSASGAIKLTTASLEDLDLSAEDAKAVIDELSKSLEGFGGPMDAFKAAAEAAFPGAEDAIEKFSLNSRASLDLYLDQLEKIAEAQRDWSTNLIRIASTLGPDIAEQFRKLGPEAAPAVEELANLSAAEMEELAPRLRAIGSDAVNELATSIIANSGKVENASLNMRTAISNTFGNLVNKAETAEEFAYVSDQYQKIIGKLKDSKVEITLSANDVEAFNSLREVERYIYYVDKLKISPEIAIDMIKARLDIGKLQQIIAEAKASGKLDAKGLATLDARLFHWQLTRLVGELDALKLERRLDADGKGAFSDEEFRAKVLALTQFLASTEGQGLLNPKGDAQLHDEKYRQQMENLALLIMGEEAVGKFDVDGSGDLDDDEFKALLQGLKDAVARANKGQLDPKGRVTLANVAAFKGQLGGIVQAAQTAGGRIQRALTRSATVRVGYFYYQQNKPPSGPKVGQAATGGWIYGPGGPRSDSIPMMLSNGEFVVNAASAKRYGALLEMINRGGGSGLKNFFSNLSESATPQYNPVTLSSDDGGTRMTRSLVREMPPESVSTYLAGLPQMQQAGPSTTFYITNQYPQAEPTSTTINRSLAYAATISGSG
jgi:TP901 family phage tail tape measure protein